MHREAPRPNRRRVLQVLGASIVATSSAGCSGGGGDGPAGDGSGDEGGSESGDRGGSGGAAATATETATTEPTADESATNSAGSATLDLSLRVRGSESNVDQFETLQTTFESVALRPSGGEAVQLAESSMDFDLTELEPGEDVSLFEATVPAGVYEELALVMPIRDATLADGSEPEFSRTVPATTEFISPFEVEEGDEIEFGVIVALVRIAGGDTWTYTIGYTIS